MAVVADPEAVSYIAERGGRLYVYADPSGLKHVKTNPPSDPAIRFRQIEAVSFLFYVADDIQEPENWSVKFRPAVPPRGRALGRPPAGDTYDSVYVQPRPAPSSTRALRGHSGTLAQASVGSARAWRR